MLIILQDTKQTPIMKIKCLIKQIKERTKNLLYDSCLTLELGLKALLLCYKIFLAQLEGQTRAIKQILLPLFSLLNQTLNFHNWHLFRVLQY